MRSNANIGNRIQEAGASSIPGLSFRRFRSEQDYPQMAEVFTRSWEADGKEAAITAEELARFKSNMKNFDPYQDLLVVESADDSRPQMVAYGRADWQDFEENDGSGTTQTMRIYAFKCYIVP